MRYFIGCLVNGGAEKYHLELCSELAKKFDISHLPSHIPSHITLKALFETKNINIVEDILKKFVIGAQKTSFELNRFGHFDNRVIFINVKASEDMNKMHLKFIQELRKVEGFEWSYNERKKANFHLTVATKGIETKFNDMWKFVSSLKEPYFKIYFNNITILKYVQGKWIVYKEYALK